MASLLLGNVKAGASDDEIRDFLVRYGFPPFDAIQHEPGDGSRPSVLLTFAAMDPVALGKLQQRIHDMYWNERRVSAHVMRDHSA